MELVIDCEDNKQILEKHNNRYISMFGMIYIVVSAQWSDRRT